MNTFIKITIFFVLFSATFLYADENIHLWVTAENGLTIRDKPDQLSNKVAIIPFCSRIDLISETELYQEIESKKGKWINIKWGKYSGYIFDGFTTNNADSLNKYRIVNSRKGLPFTNGKVKHYSLSNLIPYQTVVEFIENIDGTNLALVKYKGLTTKVIASFLILPNNPEDISLKNQITTKINGALHKSSKHNDRSIDGIDYFCKNLANYYLVTTYMQYPKGEEEIIFEKYLFKEIGSNWIYIPIENDGHYSNSIRLTDLNDDGLPDVISYGGCCAFHYAFIYIGQHDGSLKLKYKYEAEGDTYDDLKVNNITDKVVDLYFKRIHYQFDKDKGMIPVK